MDARCFYLLRTCALGSFAHIKYCTDSRYESSLTVPTSLLRPLQIVITPTSPAAPMDVTIIPPSMSRRRIARNIPALQCQVSIPPLVFSPVFKTPADITPTSTFPPLSFSQLSIFGSGPHSPVTPIDQILRTPLTPPKLPRVFPAAPRTWARLNAQARRDDPSPLMTPTFPSTPYVLSPGLVGKPLLGRLQIPDNPSDREPHGRFFAPSPQPLSPFDLSRAQHVPESARPAPARAHSSAALSRTAILRAARPSLSRSASLSAQACPTVPLSPLSPFAAHAGPSAPLASPFAIRPEAVDGGGYFCF